MRIIDVKQGTEEWLEARAGVVTASEMKNLLTPKLEPRKPDSDMVQSYLAKKLAERWLQGPLPDLWSGGRDAEQGQIMEGHARNWYQFETGQPIKTVGFIMADDGLCGCSPDGLMDHKGLEIKCPKIETHVGYLLDGVVPDEYLPQVHGSIFATGFESWDFLSYRINFPPMLLTVQRDRSVMYRISECVSRFAQQMEDGWARLIDANGSPPPKRLRINWDTL